MSARTAIVRPLANAQSFFNKRPTSVKTRMDTDQQLAKYILTMAEERGCAKTLCPSEVARSVSDDEDTWRSLMPLVTRAAVSLRDCHRISIEQRGEVVDRHQPRGPYRIRWRVPSRNTEEQ
ncbi:MAG: hypothetical protein Tsb002_35090 [Wenzhouxiangellaceae bacterium]